MRIEILSPRIGRRRLNQSELNTKTAFTNILDEMIYGALDAAVVSYSPGRLRDLMKRIRERTETEAARMFGYAINIIKNSRTGGVGGIQVAAFDAGKLNTPLSGKSPGSLSLRNPSIAQAGTVYWQNLSESWVEYKMGANRANARRFFMYSGHLTRMLDTNRRAYIGRFGGIKATHWLAKERRGSVHKMERRHAIADVEISIFPSIPMSLIPMLGSNRWTSSNNGAFERRFFNGFMAEKLIGPEEGHRPLILPILQFWMAFRIPRAIEQAVEAWSGSKRGGGLGGSAE